MVDFLATVARGAVANVEASLLAAGEQDQSLIMRLDPQQRAKVLMALLGLVLIGLLLMTLAFLGGRRLRRIVSKRHPPARRAEDEWYRKPLVPDEPSPGQTREGE